MTPTLTHSEYSRGRLLKLLDELDRVPDEGDHRTFTGLTAVRLGAESAPLLQAVLPYVERSETGAIVFAAEEVCHAIMPPYPLMQESQPSGWHTEIVRDILALRPTIAVVLLRLGGHAVGVYAGDTLVEARNDNRFVKNRHRKGGQSQRRFDRIREKQVHELFGDLCRAARTRLEPHLEELDYLAYGGDAHTVQPFLKTCPWLQTLGVAPLGRFLTVPEPRHQTLIDLPPLLSTSRVIVATASYARPAHR